MGQLLDMCREEKEQYVIQLHKEGRSTREIAKLTHMSFRDIGAVIRKVKLEADGGRGQPEEDDDYDIKSKSKTTKAIALFSELKTPVEVAIELDLPTDQVRAIYQEYLELQGFYGLAQIYEEAKYELHDLLKLHRMVKGLGMEKQEIINVLEFIKHNQLQTLQLKAQHLGDEINMLEVEKTEAMSHYFRLKRRIGEAEKILAQKRKEMSHMDHESRRCDNTGNSEPVTD